MSKDDVLFGCGLRLPSGSYPFPGPTDQPPSSNVTRYLSPVVPGSSRFVLGPDGLRSLTLAAGRHVPERVTKSRGDRSCATLLADDAGIRPWRPPQYLRDEIDRRVAALTGSEARGVSKSVSRGERVEQSAIDGTRKPAVSSGFSDGRTWDRTTDLPRVKRALSR